MLTLTDVGIEKQAQRFLDSIEGAEFNVSGQVVHTKIYRKQREKATITVSFVVALEHSGTITDIKLVDADTDVVIVSREIIRKPDNKALYVTFKYQYREEAANV